MNNTGWGKGGPDLVSDRWPKDAEGRAEESAFLCSCSNTDLDDTLLVSMLESFGIPCVRDYPGYGSFGRVIMGTSATGVDIFVPKSMLEEAKLLIKGEPSDEEL